MVNVGKNQGSDGKKKSQQRSLVWARKSTCISAASKSYMLHVQPPRRLLHSYFKALGWQSRIIQYQSYSHMDWAVLITRSTSAAEYAIGLETKKVTWTWVTDTGFWNRKACQTAKHGERGVVRDWSLASATIHMGSSHVHCQAETKHADMRFQQMVTLAPHTKQYQKVKVRGVSVRRKTENELRNETSRSGMSAEQFYSPSLLFSVAQSALSFSGAILHPCCICPPLALQQHLFTLGQVEKNTHTVPQNPTMSIRSPGHFFWCGNNCVFLTIALGEWKQCSSKSLWQKGECYRSSDIDCEHLNVNFISVLKGEIKKKKRNNVSNNRAKEIVCRELIRAMPDFTYIYIIRSLRPFPTTNKMRLLDWMGNCKSGAAAEQLLFVT